MPVLNENHRIRFKETVRNDKYVHAFTQNNGPDVYLKRKKMKKAIEKTWT